MSTMYETPVHSSMPPQATIQKAEERIPTKPSPLVLPRPVHTTAVPTAHPTSKVSGIPATSMKHVNETSNLSNT
jgi:hypothetical protein